jgi:toxin CcdB
MAQFSVHKNKNAKTRTAYPYLVDVQSGLLRDLRTRVVVPLVKLTALGKKPIKNLTPVLDVDGQKFIMLVPQLAGISLEDLGPEVASAAQYRNEIIGALDFLITGI